MAVLQKILWTLVILVVVAVAGISLYVASRQNLKFDNAPYPPVEASADSATGLGAARAIARALRCGVGHDGRALLSFMEMQGLSDEDLVAVVS